MVYVSGDLLGPALCGDVLGASQRRASALSGQVQQVLGDQRDRAPCALLPWGVGRRLDDHLAHHAPARVV